MPIPSKRLIALRQTAPVALATVVLAMVLAACGHGSDEPRLDASQQAAAAQLASRYQSDTRPTGLNATPTQAGCIATRVTAKLGAARAISLADTAQAPQLTHTEATIVAGAIARCLDVRGRVAESLVATANLDNETARCVVSKLTEADLRALLAASLRGDNLNNTDVLTKRAKPINTCTADKSRKPI